MFRRSAGDEEGDVKKSKVASVTASYEMDIAERYSISMRRTRHPSPQISYNQE